MFRKVGKAVQKDILYNLPLKSCFCFFLTFCSSTNSVSFSHPQNVALVFPNPIIFLLNLIKATLIEQKHAIRDPAPYLGSLAKDKATWLEGNSAFVSNRSIRHIESHISLSYIPLISIIILKKKIQIVDFFLENIGSPSGIFRLM